MANSDYKTNTVCRFGGPCWTEKKKNGFRYEDYISDPKLNNTDFTVDFTLKENRIVKPRFWNVVIDVHFWKFPDDIEYKIAVKLNGNLYIEPESDVPGFLYDRNVKNYIKDELEYHCGINDETMAEKIVSFIADELKDIAVEKSTWY